MSLLVDFCSSKAASYACSQWHYSRAVPMPPVVKLGAWEDDKFVGVVLFAFGANYRLGAPYALSRRECVELARVALRDHVTPVSRIVRFAIKKLRSHCPGLRMLVSYADPTHNHYGGIYQAMGWTYLGITAPITQYLYGGSWVHRRALTGKNFGAVCTVDHSTLKSRRTPGKHRYALAIDKSLDAMLAGMAKPYPKKLRAET
jgi:hypothetical protein